MTYLDMSGFLEIGPARKNWFKRNWKWVVGITLSVIGIIIGIVI